MKLSREQMMAFHQSMRILAEDTLGREDLTNRSIRGTNAVIIVLFLVGALLAGLIFGYFAALNRSIATSVDSMEAIQVRVVELRETIDGIADTVGDMGRNVEYLQFMSVDVAGISGTTREFDQYMNVLKGQTAQLSQETRFLRLNTNQMRGEFGRINRSVNSVTSSVNEGTKPIRKFMPFPQ